MKAIASVWVGRVLTALFALFMLGASAAPKLMGMPITDEIMTGLGWDTSWIFPIGILEVVLTLLYVYRPTSVLGAVLFMGLLRRRDGDELARGSAAIQPHAVQHLSRAHHVGRSVAAR